MFARRNVPIQSGTSQDEHYLPLPEVLEDVSGKAT